MPTSTVFWVVVPPIALVIFAIIFFVRTRERS